MIARIVALNKWFFFQQAGALSGNRSRLKVGLNYPWSLIREYTGFDSQWG